MSGERATGQSRMSGEERRESILAAAGRVFAAAGYEGATVERIATEAGVTKPIVYRHFGGKKDLYLCLLRRHREDLPGFLDGAGGESDIDAVLAEWLEYARCRSHGWRMLFRDRGGDDEIAAFREDVQGRAREVLAGWLASPATATVPPPQIEPTAEILRAGLAGLVLWWIDHPEARAEDLAAAAARLIRPLAGTGS